MVGQVSYTLKVWRDLHIGSGVGLPGLIDEYIVRDQNGFAHIPGSQIKGLVRESCRQLLTLRGAAELMCEGQQHWQEGSEATAFCALRGQPMCLMCVLFGAPASPGGVWFSPAEYAPGYRTTVAGAGLALRDMATSAHAAIDPGTRRAQTHQLFNLEVARPADVFRGRVERLGEWPGNAVLPEAQAWLWLTAAMLFTRRLGGRRRRGWGRCEFEIEGKEGQPAAEYDAIRSWLGG